MYQECMFVLLLKALSIFIRMCKHCSFMYVYKYIYFIWVTVMLYCLFFWLIKRYCLSVFLFFLFSTKSFFCALAQTVNFVFKFFIFFCSALYFLNICASATSGFHIHIFVLFLFICVRISFIKKKQRIVQIRNKDF